MRRLAPFLGGVPAGLVIGFAAWALAGGASISAERMDELSTQVSNLKAPPRSHSPGRYVSTADLINSPLFMMTVGPKAVKEPVVRVDGVSISKSRVAALVSIDGGAAEWMVQGDERGGVAIRKIAGSGVTIETLTGPQVIALGEQSGGGGAVLAAADTPSAPASAPSGPDEIPPGFRSPPPPASAPTAP